MDTNKNEEVRQYETLSEAITALNRFGYKEQFISTVDGIKGVEEGKIYKTDELKIVATYRFEGMNDPRDANCLFAIEGVGKNDDDIKGTLVMSYSSEHFQNIKNIEGLDNFSSID